MKPPALLLALALCGCAGGVLQQLAQPPAEYEPTAADIKQCSELAASRGLTPGQFAGRMVVLNMVRNLWAVHLFSLVGVQCGCTLVRCTQQPTRHLT